jgi:hypothetical protein
MKLILQPSNNLMEEDENVVNVLSCLASNIKKKFNFE